MSLKSAFIEIINKVAKYDKGYGIHKNGVDNNYPELVESRIVNSVTALACKDTKASFLSGKGFGDELNKLVVNKKKGTTLLQLDQDVADSIAEHNGVYIHMNYNANYEISTLEVLPFSDCRLSKTDDDKNNAKVKVCTDWTDASKAKNARQIDTFNPKKKVLEKQIEEAGGIKKYNGQVFYFRFGKYIYPLSPIHPCLDDADSEKQAGVFKNTSLRKGFFGKTLFVTKPMVDPLLNKDTDAEQIKEQESERDNFRETAKKFVGVENVDGVMHIEIEMESDKLEDEILIKNIDANIDDKLFAHTESSVSNNICIAYRIPPMLIRPTDKSLFASSGEAIREMKLFYQEQTSDERMMVEQIIKKLMALHADKPDQELKMIPLISTSNTETNADN